MICPPCRKASHAECIQANQGKAYSACDCQHRVTQKTIVIPSQEQKADDNE